jgi:antitoxin component YwqK of YwqJK toxin-antitoxin module
MIRNNVHVFHLIALQSPEAWGLMAKSFKNFDQYITQNPHLLHQAKLKFTKPCRGYGGRIEHRLPDGVLYGTVEEYDERTGEMTFEHHYVNGLMHGSCKSWCPSSSQHSRALWYDHPRAYGKPHGEWKEWHSEGHQAKVITYDAGILHGRYEEWFSNTLLKCSGEYCESLKHGEWIECRLDSDGCYIEAKGKYDRGKKLGIWCWYKDGVKYERKRYTPKPYV